jgi:hypothetical protein
MKDFYMIHQFLSLMLKGWQRVRGALEKPKQGG